GRFSDDYGVTVWDFRTGRLLFTCAEGKVIRSLAFSKDGTTLVAGGNFEVSFWSTTGGKKLSSFSIKDRDQPIKDRDQPIRGVALSPDGNWVAAATGRLPQANAVVGRGEIFIWDRRKGKLVAERKDHDD